MHFTLNELSVLALGPFDEQARSPSAPVPATGAGVLYVRDCFGQLHIFFLPNRSTSAEQICPMSPLAHSLKCSGHVFSRRVYERRIHI